MPPIFVSHATADDETANRIIAALEAAGIEIWVDHEAIHAGGNWRTAIVTALRVCEAMLLILSRTSVTRDEVTSEWSYAVRVNHKIVPVIIDDIPAADVPARLGILQWINLHTDWDTGMSALIAVLRGQS